MSSNDLGPRWRFVSIEGLVVQVADLCCWKRSRCLDWSPDWLSQLMLDHAVPRVLLRRFNQKFGNLIHAVGHSQFLVFVMRSFVGAAAHHCRVSKNEGFPRPFDSTVCFNAFDASVGRTDVSNCRSDP